ncbi:MAG: transposase, partial [Chloroflexi bacterium]|nr:transposase [Chloroflexota bacterium]
MSPHRRAVAPRGGGAPPPTSQRQRPAQGSHAQRPPSGLAGLEHLHDQRPRTLLSAEQVALLYPVRWQVELVFKLWKSEFALDRVAGYRRERVLCELYAKLIAAVLLCFLTAR